MSVVCVCGVCVCVVCVCVVCVCSVCLQGVSVVCVCSVCLWCVSVVCVCNVCLQCVSVMCVCSVCLYCVFKFRCNILISVKIIKEMPGSVASGTHCIYDWVTIAYSIQYSNMLYRFVA